MSAESEATRRDAYAASRPSAPHLKQAILEHLYDYRDRDRQSWPLARCNGGISSALGRRPGTISGRLAELQQSGDIRPDGTVDVPMEGDRTQRQTTYALTLAGDARRRGVDGAHEDVRLAAQIADHNRRMERHRREAEALREEGRRLRAAWDRMDVPGQTRLPFVTAEGGAA
jgi:hypothetical protein